MDGVGLLGAVYLFGMEHITDGLEPLLGVPELAEYLGVPVQTIYDWRVNGKEATCVSLRQADQVRSQRRARLGPRLRPRMRVGPVGVVHSMAGGVTGRR